MPVKRSYISIPVKIGDGGRLLPDLPRGTIGPANFDEKVNFVTDIGEVRKRAGWDFPAPTDEWLGVLMESFGPPCDAICGVRRPNGTYAIVGCGAGFIKAYHYDTGWVTIGSGFSTEFDEGFRFWQIEDIAGYAIFNNGRDLPVWWQIGDTTVTPLYEFREAGYASAGGMVEYVDGVLMFHDILEINDADFSAVMNDPLPYKTIVDANSFSQSDIVFTARAAAEANQWVDIAWSPSLGLFAAVAATGTNRVMTSPDGVTWTPRVAAAANVWLGIAWSPTLGLFAAVSSTGVNSVMTSPDGITWTLRATPVNTSSIVYAAGLFVAVGTAGAIMTSADGIIWTSRTSPSGNNWQAVTRGDNLFVAVALSGADSNYVITSPDGITWTARAPSGVGGWTGIAYGAGLFVAVALSGIRVMTSPDGITWTTRTAAESNAWENIVYGNGLFVAVASSGTNRIMTSLDGITWTAVQASENNSWLGIAYSPSLAIFAAVSFTGANRVMTSPDGMTLIVTRITFRRVWSNIGDPRDFAVSVPGSIDAYVDPTELTLAWPMASLEAGDVIVVIGAGTAGGNLQTAIVSINGTSVVLEEPALTTVVDADVARPTDIDSIAGWDDIEDDGSAIVCQIQLKTQLMTFKASGNIWQTYYTGDIDTPFAKDRITKKPGVAPRFPRAVISIANDDNEEYILFPGSKHFYRLDLGSQAPKQEPLFMGAEKELFFSRIKGLGIYDVWAVDNACTDEAIFAYRWDDYYSGYYGANRAIALKYAKRCESIAEIDGFLFTCAATVQKPLADFQCDEVESWFLMGDGNGAITLYGETNLEVLTLLRYGEAFEASLGGGLFSAGPASDNGSYARRFSLDPSSPEASAATTVTIYGARSPNSTPVALETKTLTDPRFPGCMGLYYRKPFFKYRLVSVAETDFRISGFIWRMGGADTQNIDRLQS